MSFGSRSEGIFKWCLFELVVLGSGRIVSHGERYKPLILYKQRENEADVIFVCGDVFVDSHARTCGACPVPATS